MLEVETVLVGFAAFICGAHDGKCICLYGTNLETYVLSSFSFFAVAALLLLSSLDRLERRGYILSSSYWRTRSLFLIEFWVFLRNLDVSR